MYNDVVECSENGVTAGGAWDRMTWPWELGAGH